MRKPDIFQRLAAKNDGKKLNPKDERIIAKVIKRQEPIVRRDISDWKNARLEATRAVEPRHTS